MQPLKKLTWEELRISEWKACICISGSLNCGKLAFVSVEALIEGKIEALRIEKKDRPLVRGHNDRKTKRIIYRLIIHISK